MMCEKQFQNLVVVLDLVAKSAHVPNRRLAALRIVWAHVIRNHLKNNNEVWKYYLKYK